MALRATLSFFYKNVNRSLAVFQSAEAACVVDKEAGSLPKSFEAIVRCM